MKSARKPLNKAYRDFLTGLVYKGVPVPVYTRMAPDKGAPSLYVIIGPWTPKSDNDKDVFVETGTILIDVVSRFDDGTINIEPTGTVAEDITSKLQPKPGAEVLHIEGFASTCTIILNAGELAAPMTTDRIHRTLIMVQHTLEQLDN